MYANTVAMAAMVGSTGITSTSAAANDGPPRWLLRDRPYQLPSAESGWALGHATEVGARTVRPRSLLGAGLVTICISLTEHGHWVTECRCHRTLSLLTAGRALGGRTCLRHVVVRWVCLWI